MDRMQNDERAGPARARSAAAPLPGQAAAPDGARTRRLAYLGTPEAAVAPLRALVEAGHDIAIVVTRPDRRRGRGAALSPSPVKREAQRLGLPVAYDLDAMLDTGLTLGVVVAYGRIIPADVLERVPMVNVHFSLLPRWRGAAPVERAVLEGDPVTGVSIMAVEQGLDTGPLYAAESLAVGEGESVDELRARLAQAGARLLVDVLGRPLPDPVPQSGEPTYAAKIHPEELVLRWDRDADQLARVVRLGRAWTTWRGRRLRVLQARAEADDRSAAPGSAPGAPGTLLDDAVATGRGSLRLLRVQPEGRAPMTAAEWLRGARPRPGERLGSTGPRHGNT